MLQFQLMLVMKLSLLIDASILLAQIYHAHFGELLAMSLLGRKIKIIKKDTINCLASLKKSDVVPAMCLYAFS